MTGGIPQAIVRTDDGQTSRVRTIDLEPVTGQSGATTSPPPANAGDGSAGRPDA